MASTSNEQKQSDEPTKEKGEDLSRAITKLYRLSYESMQDGYDSNELQIKYGSISSEFGTILSANDYPPPSSSTDIIDSISKLVSSASDHYIYGQRDEAIEQKDAKVALVEYCASDNIDQAILFILNYKLEHKTATDIMNYVHSVSAGWSSYSYAAIHKALGKINRSSYEYQNKDDIKKRFGIEDPSYSLPEEEREKIQQLNKPKEAKRDEYIANIIDSKHARTVLLVEIFLREKTSTTLKSSASGWRVSAKNETVFNQALATDNMDALRAIFQYGIDIDIDTTCTSGGSSMRTDWGSSWKPIHTAIKKCNYELTKLIIGRGANINCYRTETMSNEYGSRQDEQKTALYVICSALDDKNKMLKLILQTHEQKHNGIPDVNKFNCFITNESKPKDVVKAQKKAAKRRQKEENARYRAVQEGNDADAAAAAVNDEEEEEEDGRDDPRSGYYINPFVNLYNYETTMHVAIRKCDVEMIQLLLIYGGDITLCNVQTPSGYGGGGGWYGSRSNSKELDRSVLMRQWYEQFMKQYKTSKQLKPYESVKDVYAILKAAKGDDKRKAQIKKIFDTKSIWFPQMLHFYPNNMGKALQVITESLADALPIVMVNMIIEYFYNIVEQQIKEADQKVDISNVKAVKDTSSKPNI